MEDEAIKQKDNGYLIGILGAILGGAVCTIPWILVYLYGNSITAAFAAIIAAGAFYGFKLFKGKIDKKLPIIIMIISIILVSVAILVVIPLFLLHRDGFKVSLEGLNYVYSSYANALLQDFIISLIFTILGARAITTNIKNQIQNGNTKIDLANTEQRKQQTDEIIKLLKPVFTKYGATSKEKAIMKEEIVTEFDDSIKAEEQLKYLKSTGIIKKYQGKFYYSEENENNQEKRAKRSKIKVIAIIAIVIIVILGLGLINNNSKPKENTNRVVINTVEDTYVKYNISSNWDTFEDYTEEYIAYYGWDYYRYINNLPNTEEKQKEYEESGETDYQHIPAGINVYYSEMENKFEDVQELMEILIEEVKKNNIEEYTVEVFTTQKGYNGAYVKAKYEGEGNNLIKYEYYILNDTNIAIISGGSYILEDTEELEKEVKQIVDSFEWK